MDHPTHITKYFSEDALKYYKAGQLKFGTLEEYRNQESLLLRMKDNREGRALLGINSDGNAPINVNVGGTKIVGGTFSAVGAIPILFEQEFNEHICCFSSGKYNRDHHKIMLNHNRDLTHCIEIELEALVVAIKNWLLAKMELTKSEIQQNVLRCERVKYGTTIDRVQITGQSTYNNSLDGRSSTTDIATFGKPNTFSYENEYRIVLNLCGNQFAAKDSKPFYMSSKNILDTFSEPKILES